MHTFSCMHAPKHIVARMHAISILFKLHCVPGPQFTATYAAAKEWQI